MELAESIAGFVLLAGAFAVGSLLPYSRTRHYPIKVSEMSRGEIVEGLAWGFGLFIAAAIAVGVMGWIR